MSGAESTSRPGSPENFPGGTTTNSTTEVIDVAALEDEQDAAQPVVPDEEAEDDKDQQRQTVEQVLRKWENDVKKYESRFQALEERRSVERKKNEEQKQRILELERFIAENSNTANGDADKVDGTTPAGGEERANDFKFVPPPRRKAGERRQSQPAGTSRIS
ncbi:unnamed protein product, partial [Amoebophrya sp. A120]|eukprot:GSA120T00025562001.1